MKLLSVTPAPHIWAKDDTQSIMRDVLIALAPAFIASIVIFGIDALLVTVVCVAAAVLSEFIFEKAVKRPVTITLTDQSSHYGVTPSVAQDAFTVSAGDDSVVRRDLDSGLTITLNVYETGTDPIDSATPAGV